MEGSGRNPEGEVFLVPHSSLPNPALFMVQLSPQTDSFIIQPIFWVEILLQPSHSVYHPGAGNGQVKRFACGEHICQALLVPGIPAHPEFMTREEVAVLLPSQQCPEQREEARTV